MTRRKTTLSTAIIIALALAGLVVVNVGQGDAAVQMVKGTSQSTVEEGPEAPFDGSAYGALARMVAALAVVIACIYVGVYLLKKLGKGKLGRKSGGDLLEVIETTHLGPKRMISLVRVADKAVLVGVGESQMTLLTELDPDQTAVALSSPPKDAAPTGPLSFDRLIAKAMAPWRRRPADRQEAAASVGR